MLSFEAESADHVTVLIASRFIWVVMPRNPPLSIVTRLAIWLLQLPELYNTWSVGKDHGAQTDSVILRDCVAGLSLEWKQNSTEGIFVMETKTF